MDEFKNLIFQGYSKTFLVSEFLKLICFSLNWTDFVLIRKVSTGLTVPQNFFSNIPLMKRVLAYQYNLLFLFLKLEIMIYS